MLASPVTFGGTARTNPMDVNQRYGVVFRFNRDESSAVRFLGTVMFDEDGIKTAGRKASEWFVR